MRQLAAGVTVVTTMHEDRPQGMTATSFNSVSLDPMLVQVSLAQDSRTHGALVGSGLFAVNLLASDQLEIARLFASPLEERFTDLTTTDGATGVPLIAGALAGLECRVTEELPGGDHTIFVGEVLHAHLSEGEPLVHYDTRYWTLRDL